MYGYKPRQVDAIEIVTEADGTKRESNLKKCCHCGAYWKSQPGSGILRGRCFRCNDDICGPNCMECHPYEQKLLDIGKRLNVLREEENVLRQL